VLLRCVSSSARCGFVNEACRFRVSKRAESNFTAVFRVADENLGYAILLIPASRPRPQGVMAMTRKGLPEPPAIFRGAAMTTAPVGGS
jgi:hypothetical protein